MIWLIPLAFAGWFGMNNLVVEHVTPSYGSFGAAVGKMIFLLIIGFVCAGVGLWLLLPPPTGIGLLSKWIVLPLVIFCTVMGMRYLSPGALKRT